MHRERNERFQTSLRDFPDTAARSQDWRPGLLSRRPSGTSLTPPRDPRTGVLGYSQSVPPGLRRDGLTVAQEELLGHGKKTNDSPVGTYETERVKESMMAHAHAGLFDHCVFSTKAKTARDRMR